MPIYRQLKKKKKNTSRPTKKFVSVGNNHAEPIFTLLNKTLLFINIKKVTA